MPAPAVAFCDQIRVDESDRAIALELPNKLRAQDLTEQERGHLAALVLILVISWSPAERRLPPEAYTG